MRVLISYLLSMNHTFFCSFLFNSLFDLTFSSPLDIALLENNARIGAQLAVLFAKQISNKKSTSKISMDSNMIKTCSAKMMKKEKPPKIVSNFQVGVYFSQF